MKATRPTPEVEEGLLTCLLSIVCLEHGTLFAGDAPEELPGKLSEISRRHWPSPWRGLSPSTLPAPRSSGAHPCITGRPGWYAEGVLVAGNAAHASSPMVGGFPQGLFDVATLSFLERGGRRLALGNSVARGTSRAEPVVQGGSHLATLHSASKSRRLMVTPSGVGGFHCLAPQ
jgi:hypothetical protein